MKKIIFFLILFLSVSFLTNAQSCSDYADTAVRQYKKAKEMKIPGTDGLGWSDNRDAHFNWCKTVPFEIAQKENVKRQEIIDNFLKNNQKKNKQDPNAISAYKTIEITPTPDMTHLIGFKDRISENYAKESVRQNKENLSNACGFNDATWSSDYNAHKNWCMHGDNYLKADKVLADRERQLKACKGDHTIWVSGMVLGLRNSKNNNLDPFIPSKKYYDFKKLDKYISVKAYDNYDPSFDGGVATGAPDVYWSWFTIDKGAFSSPNQYNLPPGIVISLMDYKGSGLKGVFGIDQMNKNNSTKNIRFGPEFIGGGKFQKKCGGDLGAPAGQGLCWYESTGLGFSEWSQVNNLPRGTVIGLKHSSNQPNKKLIWQGHVYNPADPNIKPPTGFARKEGGDIGAPAGVGYFWYEKVTGE